MTSWPCYEVLSYHDPGQRQKWRAICDSFRDIDIYFYPEYAYMLELHGDGKAYCFVYYQSKEHLVIYPFLKRPINEIPIFTDLADNVFDILIPYGYGGYLRNSDSVDMNKFYMLFRQYCTENGIVSEFVRFHPILKNYLYCPDVVNIQLWNETVVIDLTQDEESIWKNMRQERRNKISRAKKYAINILEDKDFAYLDDFYFMYSETMNRVKAHNYYYFSKQWFYDMVHLLRGNIFLFNAFYQGSIIGSSIFLGTGAVLNNYLSGTKSEGRHMGSHNLLIYIVALWAKSQGIKYFHLGGGLEPDDKLFKYKTAFSPIRAQYYLGKVIHNHETYQYLSDRKLALLKDPSEKGDYFPLYRQ